MRKVLITGANGFIGRPCLDALAAAGDQVHAIVRPGTELRHPPVIVHPVDLHDIQGVTALIATLRPTHLLHLAWIATPGVYLSSPENRLWLASSVSLLKAFAEKGGKRVVVTGSCAEYDWSAGQCHETRTLLAPSSVYGQCKNELRLNLEQIAGDYGLSSAWARLFWLHGPREHPRRLVAATIQALLRGEPVTGPFGNHARDFLHVEDAASAIVTLLRSDTAGPVNIGSGDAIPISSLIQRIVLLSDDTAHGKEVVLSRDLPQEPPLVTANVERLRREVCWQPRFTLDEGLRHTISWWRAQRRERHCA